MLHAYLKGYEFTIQVIPETVRTVVVGRMDLILRSLCSTLAELQNEPGGLKRSIRAFDLVEPSDVRIFFHRGQVSLSCHV